MSDKPKNLSDIDRFWDLEKLLPNKRQVSPVPRQPNTDTVEIEFGGDNGRAENTAVPPRSAHDTARVLNELPLRQRASEYRSRPLDPYLIYTPKSKLIRRVEVSAWDTRFNFYENFITDAKRLWNRSSSECAPASFFSYIPQYSQLKYAQLKWYLWWRDNLRRGVYLRCDFCYILLYIYEILNCPDLMPPSEGVNVLCDVWLNFRAEHPRIDSYMCEWLCDYCLIHGLPCPTEKLEPILGDIASKASFREFYMDAADGGAAGAAMLAHTSTYDWRKSRYVTSENIGVFAVHIKAAFDKAYREILSNDGEEFSKEFRIERTSYEGALCVYSIKRTVAVEYISFTRSPKFRFAVTDIIKYSENRVRMALGIKSRLKVENLTDKLRACIDDYFDVHIPAPKKTRSAKYTDLSPAVNEYDKLYEPQSSELSLENALKIEERSWATTDILTAAFDEPEAVVEVREISMPEEPVFAAEVEKTEEYSVKITDDGDEFAALVNSLDEASVSALRMLLAGDADGVKKASEGVGSLADALADRINETAFDIIGDSIIEPDGSGYKIISDYEGDIEKWLK